MEFIGEGLTARVYRSAPDRVIKVFHPHVDDILAQREFAFSSLAHRAGVPTPRPLELLERDGQRCLEFVFCPGATLDTHTLPRPWRYGAASAEMAQLHCEVHQHQVDPAAVDGVEHVSQKALLEMLIGFATPLSENQRDECLVRLAALPGGTALCHGDFAPSNLMFHRGHCSIIDWSLGCVGCPAGDVAMTWIGVGDLAQASDLSGFVKAVLRFSANRYVDGYQAAGDGFSHDELTAWLAPVAAARLGALIKGGGDAVAISALGRLLEGYLASKCVIRYAISQAVPGRLKAGGR